MTPAYGGSLRIFVRHTDEAGAPASSVPASSVDQVLAAEAQAGLTSLATYRWFADRVDQARRALRAFLDECRQEGRIVVAYGAPSRGNTFLNSAGATGADVAFANRRGHGADDPFDGQDLTHA